MTIMGDTISNSSFRKLIIDPLKSWKYIALLFFGFSIILGFLQYFLLQYWQYSPTLLEYFIFKTDSITIQSLYLSNFVNKNWSFFLFNMLLMWIGLILIFIGEKQKNIFWINIFFILIIAPFILSLLNIRVISLIPGTGSLGYSGIATLFLGYGFYSLLKYFHDVWEMSPNKAKYSKNRIYSIIGFIFLLPIISFVFLADPIEFSFILQYGLISGIFQTFIQTKINMFIHVIGYLLGFIVAFISHKISREKILNRYLME
jgi:hypothetical protein